MKYASLLLIILLAASCGDPKKELTAALVKYDHFTFKIEGDSLADFYVANGKLGGKGMKKYIGRDTIRKFLTSFKKSEIHMVSNKTTAEKIELKGDTAYVDGTYEQKAKLPTGDTGVYKGTFSSRWVKDCGRWRIASMYTVPAPGTLRSVLLRQLKTTHTEKDWFVPIRVAIDGVTAQQAMWKDGSGNHSIGQLTFHLLFWNQRMLKNFRGEAREEFSGNNDETFDKFDEKKWAEITSQLDQVLTDWENEINKASEEKLADWYGNIANMNTHNAYHTGQIVFVRKLQKTWDPSKGVK